MGVILEFQNRAAAVRIEQETLSIVRARTEIRHHINGHDGKIAVAVNALIGYAHEDGILLQQDLHIQRHTGIGQIVMNTHAIVEQFITGSQLLVVEQHSVGDGAGALFQIGDVHRQEGVGFLLVQTCQLAGKGRIIH